MSTALQLVEKDEEHKAKSFRRNVRTVSLSADIKGNQKVCKTCQKTKPIVKFPLRGNHRLNSCNPCYNDFEALKQRVRYRNDEEYRAKKIMKSRKIALKHRYGITPEHADSMLAAQHGLCANRGCGSEISFTTSSKNEKRAVIDHCHKTNVVRAVLCDGCNLLLGRMEKSKNVFLGLIEYIEKHNKSRS